MNCRASPCTWIPTASAIMTRTTLSGRWSWRRASCGTRSSSDASSGKFYAAGWPCGWRAAACFGRSGDFRHAVWHRVKGEGCIRFAPSVLGDGTVPVLDQYGAGFHPVAAVWIANAVHVANLGVVDMPANHPLEAALAAFVGEGLLEFTDEIHRLLHPVLEITRQ